MQAAKKREKGAALALEEAEQDLADMQQAVQDATERLEAAKGHVAQAGAETQEAESAISQINAKMEQHQKQGPSQADIGHASRTDRRTHYILTWRRHCHGCQQVRVTCSRIFERRPYTLVA